MSDTLKAGVQVVHFRLGPGRIERIDTMMLAGAEHQMAHFLSATGTKVMLPVAQASSQVRALASDDEVAEALALLSKPADVRPMPWNRRYRWMQSIMRGVDDERQPLSTTLLDLAEVLRVVADQAQLKALSFGERQIASTMRGRISAEIAAATGRNPEKVAAEIDGLTGLPGG